MDWAYVCNNASDCYTLVVCGLRVNGQIRAFQENSIVAGDCLDMMKQMPDGCVDFDILDVVRHIVNCDVAGGDPAATFDQLAEEILELHLALRGKHSDPPAMEWLEIAVIAINALGILPLDDVLAAEQLWIERHG